MPDEKPFFDYEAIIIGDKTDDTGERIGAVDFTLSRCSGHQDQSAHSLVSLTLTTDKIDISLVGLDVRDIRCLARFFDDYANRLASF